MKNFTLLSALFAFSLFSVQARATSMQDAQQQFAQQMRDTQTQEQAIQQSTQQSFQTFEQTTQQYIQTAQQQQTVNQQALYASGSANAQSKQPSMQISQQAISQSIQTIQQSLNQQKQAAQTIIQNAQQSIQQNEQQIAQDINGGDFQDIAGIEATVQQQLSQEQSAINGLIQQAQAAFQQQQTVIQNALTAEASLGNSKAPTAVNGACGLSNGQSLASVPAGNLCSSGSASSVSGSGPWAWSCAGSSGGTTATCQATSSTSATKTIATNAACGSASGGYTATVPTTNLCSSGTATAVTGSSIGPWNWNCMSANGENNASCQSYQTQSAQSAAINGTCGSSNETTLSSTPTSNLCSSGSATSVSGSGPWAWSCAGSNGGSAASCQASVAAAPVATNGTCGSSNGTTLSSTPTSNLCSTGSATSVSGSGPWAWSCAGSNGGSAASCQASVAAAPVATNGTCGSSNGTTLSSTPTSNLCSTGSATSVSGSGPWAWSCAGSNGGSAASCQASVAAAPVATNGTCGSSNGTTLSSTPTSNLCSTGSATSVSGSGPWAWSCAGSNGGSNASCGAQLVVSTGTSVDGVCGGSNGGIFSGAPVNNLCSVGTPSAVGGTGPWAWTCGSGSDMIALCSAQSINVVIDGACGTAASAVLSSVPSGDSLCAFGTASTVKGSGPWNWTCTPPDTTHQTANCWAHSTNEGSFYVSPSGSDTNPGTAAAPFKTLQRAKLAMENSTTIKTTYVGGGTYSDIDTTYNDSSNPSSFMDPYRTGNVSLWLHGALNGADGSVIPSDDGEAWLAYPGQTPVIDGLNSISRGVLAGAGNWVFSLTLHGLTFQNYSESGIDMQASSGNIIDDNRILNIATAQPYNGAAVYLHWSFSNSAVTHNLVQNAEALGLSLVAGSSTEVNNNVLIRDNIVLNACYGLSDCGGIYLLDRGHVSTGQVVDHNIVGNVNNGANKGIYLDDESSKIQVTNNIVYGTGQYGLQIHGSDYALVENNIFDVSQVSALGLYQDDVGSGFPNYGMAGNVFAHNIIYASGSAGRLWDYLNQSNGTIASPADYSNLYYSATGSYQSSNTNGGIVDTQAVFGNPGFNDPASHDYSLPANNPASTSISFRPIDTSGIGNY